VVDRQLRIVLEWTERMAAAAGGGGDDDQWEPPRTPHLVLKDGGGGGGEAGELTPDTEDNVASQTDGVFRHFVYQLRAMQQHDDDDTPAVPELSAFDGESPLS